MDIHEYQTKDLFRAYGIPVPEGVPADTPEVTFEARATKPGRSLVFGEIDLFLPNGKRAAAATTTTATRINQRFFLRAICLSRTGKSATTLYHLFGMSDLGRIIIFSFIIVLLLL